MKTKVLAHQESTHEDGVIYVGSLNGKVHAIAPDGKARWVVPLRLDPSALRRGQRGVGSAGSITVGNDGAIYVAITNALIALDRWGAQAWSITGWVPI